MPRRRRGRDAARLLAVGLAAVLLAEGAARFFPASRPDNADLFLVWAAGRQPALREADGRLRSDDELARLSNPRVELDVRPAPGTERVLCVGDSTTAGWPYHPRGGYPRFLQAVLEDRLPGRKIEVIGAGFHGFDSERVSEVLEQALAARPRVVVIRAGYNDYQMFAARHPASSLAARAQELRLALIRRCGLYNLLRRAAGLKGEDSSLQAARLEPLGERAEGVLVADYEARVARMIDEARAVGAGVVVLGLPASRRFNPDLPYLPLLPRLEDSLRRAAREHGASFVPLDGLGEERFVDAVHPDLEGYRMTALAAARAIERGGWLAPPSAWKGAVRPLAEHARRLGLDDPEFQTHLRVGLALFFLQHGDRASAAREYALAKKAAPNPRMIAEELSQFADRAALEGLDEKAAPRRSAVLVVVDALRPDDLGAYGCARATSPGLDRLAASGALFSRAFAQSSWTLPSLATLMTSLYPSVHGAMQSPGEGDWGARLERGALALGPGQRLDASRRTLAETLRAAGWATAGFVGGAFPRAAFGFDKGFDVWREANLVDELLPDARRFVRAHRDGGFFLYLHAMGVHAPYAAPPRWDADYRGSVDGSTRTFALVDQGKLRLSPRDLAHLRARYDDGVTWVDRGLGALFDELRAAGLLDSTLVVVTADHGEAFLEHGRLGHGDTLYDELLRVPLIARAPGLAARRIDEPVGLVDVAPTILDWLGAPPLPAAQGRSLLPLLRGGRIKDNPLVAQGRRFDALRSGRWKLIAREGAAEQLYDLVADPGETVNVIEKRPDERTRLEALLRSWRAQAAKAARALPALGAARPDLPAEAREKLEAAGYLR